MLSLYFFLKYQENNFFYYFLLCGLIFRGAIGLQCTEEREHLVWVVKVMLCLHSAFANGACRRQVSEKQSKKVCV